MITDVILLERANALADAAEKLGKCSSMDAARPEHYKNCARCAVKEALRKYREVTQTTEPVINTRRERGH